MGEAVGREARYMQDVGIMWGDYLGLGLELGAESHSQLASILDNNILFGASVVVTLQQMLVEYKQFPKMGLKSLKAS